MPLESRRLPQPDALADGGEVVAGTAIGQAFAAIRDEEGCSRCYLKPLVKINLYYQ
jgi:hypothetical protein